MAGRGHLDREKLYELFETLDKELRHERGDRTVIYVAGGARMALGLHDGRTTNDIDCVIRENHGAASKAVRKITERAKLPNDWLNEELGQVMPKSPDTGEVTLFSGSKLVVKGASAKRMLGMKICAHRKIDIDDAKVLVKRLNLKSTKEIQKITEDLYEEYRSKPIKDIAEGLKLIADEMPQLKVNHRREPAPTAPTREFARGSTTGEDPENNQQSSPIERAKSSSPGGRESPQVGTGSGKGIPEEPSPAPGDASDR